MAKLSDPSRTMSIVWDTSERMFSASTVLVIGLDRDLRIDRRQSLSARLHFRLPTVAVECRICRCKFERSTTSPSTSPMVPTPAAARYESGRRAQPTGSDEQHFALLSFSWPLPPTSLQNNVAAVSLNLLFGQFHGARN